MSRHDLTAYKQSKIIVKDIAEIRKALRDSYKSLNNYKKYTPVKPILDDILSAEITLKLFADKHKNVVKTKGKL